jgi:hypothetical protein
MARFYGIVNGYSKTVATRRGGTKSGLATTAASWSGAVLVRLYDRDGTDYALVKLTPWHGHGITKTLYDGPVSGLPATVPANGDGKAA